MHIYFLFSTDDADDRLPVSKDLLTGDHTVSQPDCLYGPQVIDVIVKKPGKINNYS